MARCGGVTEEPSTGKPTIALFTATCLVIANMVGTGIFTSLGFQVGDLPSGFVLSVLWLIGGVCALCGAFCYAELAAALPRSGGEYHLVGRTLHPSLGFLAGWLSATVGFAAPIALASMALGDYAMRALYPSGGVVISPAFWPHFSITGAQAIAMLAVSVITCVHLVGVRTGSTFQNGATLFKLSLVAFVLVAGLCAGQSQPIHFTPTAGDRALFGHPAFALSLVYVMYAYTGWNAATYIVGEIRNPARNVPRALLIGTGVVTLLYILLNAVFLRTTPIAELRGQVEVGLIAGQHIFGEEGGRIIGGFICVGLLATISAMTWVGPRAASTMGEDHRALRWLAVRSASGVPRNALLTQLLIVGALIVSSSFERVLVFIQFPLTLCSGLAIVGLMVLRVREPNLPRPFRVPFYPLPPLIFLAISGWMLLHAAQEKPRESAAGTLAMLCGLGIYFLPKSSRRQP